MAVCGCRVSDVAGGVAEALANGTGRSEVWTLGGPVDGMDRRCRDGPGKKLVKHVVLEFIAVGPPAY